MAGEDLLLRRFKIAACPDRLHIAHHDRERFARPSFPLPQKLYSRLVPGVAAQVKAADSFDGNDPAAFDHTARLFDRVSATQGCIFESSLAGHNIHLRTAVIAADRLRVIAPARRIMIFVTADPAHREHLHAGALPVVGERVEDCKARPARRAVDERVQVPPVPGIEQFPRAVIAGRDIRRDEDLARCLLADCDLKAVVLRRLLLLRDVDL